MNRTRTKFFFSKSHSTNPYNDTTNLANLLPTGTILVFNCDPLTRLMTQVLLFSIAGACFLASFTDIYRSPDGKLYYGFATFKGICSRSSVPFVFMAVALKRQNVVNCFYPLPEHGTQQILNIIPTAVGVICSSLFVVFPTRRHGIGYPVSSSH
ncbi:hypothetical protein MKW92_012252 [Papaver armeniacum]|nr:hypothetical protein MKW92_012252 [Papaver armeniacum]